MPGFDVNYLSFKIYIYFISIAHSLRKVSDRVHLWKVRRCCSSVKDEHSPRVGLEKEAFPRTAILQRAHLFYKVETP